LSEGKKEACNRSAKKPLQPNDFPIQTEDKKIVKRDGQPMNEDEGRREEDNWSA